VDGRSQHIIATAPPGFGKTTLLRNLSEQARAAGAKIAWITIASEHEDTATFVAGIIESLHALRCGFSIAFHKDAVPGHATGLRELCRSICSRLRSLPYHVALFIDDYHSVRANEAIGLFMEELTQAAPVNFQVVLASRSLPNFSTIRLRLDSRLLQLTSRELQFSYEEAERFYGQLHHLALSPEQLMKILARTDGWVAGLQIVALALKRSAHFDDVIDAFSGNFHEIAEYLGRYVIEGLAAELVTFLLDTSVLERLSPDLCAAVTRDSGAGALLAKVQASNLFVRALDETHTWFTYHQLFRDFLRSQLNLRDPTRETELHRRASAWYAAQRLPHGAIEHALSAGDHDLAAQLVEDFAQERIDIGGMADVERWINMIPAEIVGRHPRFQLFKGWALCHICKYHEADDILTSLEHEFAAHPGDDPLRARELKYELAVLRSVNSLGGDDVAAALKSLPDDPPEQSKHMRRLTAMRFNVEGACNIFMSRFDAAERALTRAYTLHLSSGSLNGSTYALCYLGYVRLLSGSLREAGAKFEQAELEALARSGRDSFCYALPRALRGLISDERDDVQTAESLIINHFTPVEEGGYIGFRRALFLRLARILMDRGQFAAADEVLHRLLRSCDEMYVVRTQLLITLERAKFAMRAGDVAESARLVNKLPAHEDLEPLNAWQNDLCEPGLARAQWAMLRGDAQGSFEMLRPLKRLAESANRWSNLQEICVLEARAAFALGQQDSSGEALLRGLAREDSRVG
jgi:ATP/maltotriose-dependent transcriptional regulator MalT